MNNQHVKGSVHKTKGKIKEEVGHMSGNSGTAIRGVAEQIKGKIENGLGDMKDAIKKGVDNLLESRSEKKH